MLAYVSMVLLCIVGVFLIFIILLQRGRGGGLVGALGGMGGQSAFGTKAGDVFTKITIVVVAIWIGLVALSIYALRTGATSRFPGGNVPNAGELGAPLVPDSETDGMDSTPFGESSGAESAEEGAVGEPGVTTPVEPADAVPGVTAPSEPTDAATSDTSSQPAPNEAGPALAPGSEPTPNE